MDNPKPAWEEEIIMYGKRDGWKEDETWGGGSM
jgi:hypothetical protein